MTDSYAGGFLDGWAAAAEALRTRFDLIPRDAATGPRIDAERLGGPIRHSDPPEGKPWLVGPQEALRRECPNCFSIVVYLGLMMGSACMDCGWELL